MDQTSLPVHLTRFIGRDRELAELTSLAARARLVTLTGAGGSGKTRLASELAARAGAKFGRTVWVDLAPLSDAAFLTQQVADAMLTFIEDDSLAGRAMRVAIKGNTLVDFPYLAPMAVGGRSVVD